MKKLIAWVMLVSIILLMPVAAFAEEVEPEAQPTSVPSVTEEADPTAQSAAPDEAQAPTDPETPADPDATPTPDPTPEPTATPDQTIQYREGAPELDLEQISSVSAMLLDADTGEVLFAKNADWRIFPASTTKLMTAILVLENCSMDEMVKIGREVDQFSSTSSLMGLHGWVGKEIPVKDLLYGLMMCSGNDAAVALGVHIAGSEEAFVQMMNDRAAAMGMTGTHFLNPEGIYIANVGHDHYSTAADMAKLAVAAHQIPELVEIMQAQTYTYETEGMTETNTVESSNYLIHTPTKKPEYAPYFYDKATGMKTGTLNNILPPGYETPIRSYGCLVASAASDNLNLIAVIYGDLSLSSDKEVQPDAYARWDIARTLFDYGFANFAKVDVAQYVTPATLTTQIQGVAGNDPNEGELEVKADLSGETADVRLLDAATAQGLADGSVQLEQETELDEPLAAPISEGQQLGKVVYSLNGQEVYAAPLVAGRTVFPAGDEVDTSEEYGVPVVAFQIWYLWILIPIGLVLTLLVIRAVNKNRRRRYAGRGKKAAFSATPVRQGKNTAGGTTAERPAGGGGGQAKRPSGGRGHRL